MRREPGNLVIDARPQGPDGPVAAQRVLGRSALAHAHAAAQAAGIPARSLWALARPADDARLGDLARDEGLELTIRLDGPPAGAVVLRADRLYDARRLRRVLRRGGDPEQAVFWRLDTPAGRATADDELLRRRSYQPLGRYWALAPARALARFLAPTRVRPNAVTLAAGSLMLIAAAIVATLPARLGTNALAAACLALALVLDTADGHLARLQGTATPFGRWLDAFLDELADLALHGATAWACYARSGQPGWLVVGMAYIGGKYLFAFGNTSWMADDASTTGASAASAAGSGSALRSLAHAMGHADLRWHLWIVLAMAGRLDVALVLYTAYFPTRAAAGAIRKWRSSRA